MVDYLLTLLATTHMWTGVSVEYALFQTLVWT